jgi:hypothetical protein
LIVCWLLMALLLLLLDDPCSCSSRLHHTAANRSLVQPQRVNQSSSAALHVLLDPVQHTTHTEVHNLSLFYIA